MFDLEETNRRIDEIDRKMVRIGFATIFLFMAWIFMATYYLSNLPNEKSPMVEHRAVAKYQR